MKISQLYTYPIKSLRGVSLTQCQVTANGFPYDRRFMLLKVLDGEEAVKNGSVLKNMQVSKFTEMALFIQELHNLQHNSTGSLLVKFQRPDGTDSRSMEIPLRPDVEALDTLDVDLYGSPTKACHMGSKYNDWFSSCFGYEVILVYLGPNLRRVLGNLSPNTSPNTPAPKSWTSLISSYVPSLGAAGTASVGITFADLAAYLVVTKESLDDVSTRLPEGEEMDITKFRPNIVVDGSSGAWDEDFWGSLAIAGEGGVELELTANCHRCNSINVDYTTGKVGKGESGQVLKKLMKDRRVDLGAKWSPVFGRYGFLKASPEGINVVRIGDEAQITRRNEERTVFGESGLLAAPLSLTGLQNGLALEQKFDYTFPTGDAFRDVMGTDAMFWRGSFQGEERLAPLMK